MRKPLSISRIDGFKNSRGRVRINSKTVIDEKTGETIYKRERQALSDEEHADYLKELAKSGIIEDKTHRVFVKPGIGAWMGEVPSSIATKKDLLNSWPLSHNQNLSEYDLTFEPGPPASSGEPNHYTVFCSNYVAIITANKAKVKAFKERLRAEEEAEKEGTQPGIKKR